MRALFLSLAALAMVAAPARADGEGAKTEAGTDLRWMAKRDTAAYAQPKAAGAGKPVSQFDWLYVLPPKPGAAATEKNAAADGWVRVAAAPAESAFLGWVELGHGLYWSHAQAVGFRPKAGRDVVQFFRTAEDAKKWFAGDDSVQPLSREPADLPGSTLLPLLDVQTFTVKGEEFELVKVAHVRRAAGEAVRGAQLSRERVKAEFALEVAYVLDTTASMTDFLQGVLAVLEDMTKRLAEHPQLKGRLKFAVIAYRDVLDTPEANKRLEYHTKLICPFTADPEEVVKALKGVQAASENSGDTPEDVLAGLDLAIEKAGWSEVSAKTVVLVGDASAQLAVQGFKNPGRHSIASIKARLQPTKPKSPLDLIQLHAVQVLSHDKDDHDRCRKHFSELADGREKKGRFLVFKDDEVAKFRKELTDELTACLPALEQIVQGRLDKLPAAGPKDRGTTLGGILDAVGALSPGADAGAEFAEAWAVTTDRKGALAVEPLVLVRRNDLERYHAAVEFLLKVLDGAGEPGKKDVKRIVQQLQVMVSGLNLDLQVDADTPAARLLELVLGFPIRTPVFELSPAKLSAMVAKDWEDWRGQVRASNATVKAHLDNGKLWFSLAGDAKAKAPEKHAFIKAADLP